MDQLEQEDWLDRNLREAAPYIDDGGFTARVLEQLPPTRKRHQFLRATILLVSSILASALSFVLSGNARFIAAGVERFATLPMIWIFGVAAAAGAIITSAGLAAAIYKTRELQSY
jgi:hypothetical protein